MSADGYGQDGCSADDAHDVGFLHDEKVFAVELDFRAGPLAEQHNVALLEVDWRQLASFITAKRDGATTTRKVELLVGNGAGICRP